MKFVFYTNSVSPHQLPLARELVKVIGVENYLYLYTTEQTVERTSLGWNINCDGIRIEKLSVENQHWLDEADVLMSGIRDMRLFARRKDLGKRTIYTSERWFKPIPLLSWHVRLPGWFRIFFPSYLKKVRRFVKWMNEDVNARVLSIGPWAKKDFLRMGVKPTKIVDWGYFVAPSKYIDEKNKAKYDDSVHALPAEKSGGVLRLLWCGRLLGLKRVGDIVRAVGEHVGLKRERVSLTIVGDGPEKERLMKMAKGLPITFLPSHPIDDIREMMHEHDCYVLSSNAFEGWGAVVSEALEEGMNVLGTYEAGSSATLLPVERLYHTGNVKELVRLIEKECRGELPACSIGQWTAYNAAERLKDFIK